MAKLKEENIFEIRKLIKAGMNQRKIGKLFGVDHTNISSINLRKTWAHI